VAGLKVETRSEDDVSLEKLDRLAKLVLQLGVSDILARLPEIIGGN
jgi:hypothetical protein